MIWHVIDCYQLLAAGHVFLKFIVMLSRDQVLPSLHSENNLNVDLGVRIRHFYAAINMSLLRSCTGVWMCMPINMSLLTELNRCLDAYGYKDVVPTELQATSIKSRVRSLIARVE